MAFTVVYDACVLYPVRLRDFLLRAGYTPQLNLRARTSPTILDELGIALVRNNAMPADRWPTHRSQIEGAIPDFIVDGYERLIESIELPDANDRHVVAAAIRCQASAIITFNLADFPVDALEPFDIEPVHPDDFCLSLVEQSGVACVELIHQQLVALRRPPISLDELLQRFERMGSGGGKRRQRGSRCQVHGHTEKLVGLLDKLGYELIAALIPGGAKMSDEQPFPELPDTEPPSGVKPYTDKVPVIFGHYCYSGKPEIVSKAAACVDYSAGKGGDLIAHRWHRSDTEFTKGQFIAY